MPKTFTNGRGQFQYFSVKTDLPTKARLNNLAKARRQSVSGFIFYLIDKHLDEEERALFEKK